MRESKLIDSTSKNHQYIFEKLFYGWIFSGDCVDFPSHIPINPNPLKFNSAILWSPICANVLTIFLKQSFCGLLKISLGDQTIADYKNYWPLLATTNQIISHSKHLFATLGRWWRRSKLKDSEPASTCLMAWFQPGAMFVDANGPNGHVLSCSACNLHMGHPTASNGIQGTEISPTKSPGRQWFFKGQAAWTLHGHGKAWWWNCWNMKKHHKTSHETHERSTHVSFVWCAVMILEREYLTAHAKDEVHIGTSVITVAGWVSCLGDMTRHDPTCPLETVAVEASWHDLITVPLCKLCAVLCGAKVTNLDNYWNYVHCTKEVGQLISVDLQTFTDQKVGNMEDTSFVPRIPEVSCSCCSLELISVVASTSGAFWE